MEPSVKIAVIGMIASIVSSGFAASATVLSNRNRAHLEKVQEALKENTDVSVKAFQEANHVNNKISNLQSELRDKKTAQGDRIEATGEDTHRLIVESNKNPGS